MPKILKKAPMQIFLLLLVSFLLLWGARTFPAFSDWYAKNIYPIFLNTFGRFFSVFPFSFIEMSLYIGIILLIVMILKKKFIMLSWIVSILFFLFVINCGIHYSRTPFSQVSRLEVGDYTLEELNDLCVSLTAELNYWSAQVERDKEGIAMLDCDISAKSTEAMLLLGNTYDALSGFYANPKPVWNSFMLSYQHISGIFSPFTIEANYDRDMVPYNIPFTVCHELSHLKGFMREDEANYIAYLACLQSDEAIFNYSGNLLAWVYSTNELYAADRDAYNAIRAELDPVVNADLSANAAFWDKYEGKISELSETVNDLYLKSNNQAEGIKSYNRMVSLLIANHQ